MAPRYDFRSPRLYVDAPLHAGASLPLDAAQAHYLADVLRLKEGDHVLVFNGREGEWRGALASAGKKRFALRLTEHARAQIAPTDLHYLFAPLKRARLDYMVQKAVEMGASKLAPVITRHTNAERVNIERMRANAIEAAEQCGILNLPEIVAPQPFAQAIAALEVERILVFCDEKAEVRSPVDQLIGAQRQPAAKVRNVGVDHHTDEWPTTSALAVIVGPEGGFSEDERRLLLARPNTVRLNLGPRILRADTAAVAALALVQTALGDWQG